jgi:hypothetical protein
MGTKHIVHRGNHHIWGILQKGDVGEEINQTVEKHESCKHIHVIDMFKMESMVNQSGQFLARIPQVVELITTFNFRLTNPEVTSRKE